MKKISCNIIQDILPLYLDDVVSDDTKKMVEEHLQSCEDCNKEVEALKGNVVLPANHSVKLAEAQVLKNFKMKFFKRKVIISAVSIIAAIAVVIGLYSLLFVSKMYIPYDRSLISVDEIDGQMYAYYHGGSFAGSVSHHPATVVIEGKEKEIVVFYYYDTFWSKYIAPVFSDIDSQNGNKAMIPLGDADQIDNVYYGEFDNKHFMKELPVILDKWDVVWGE